MTENKEAPVTELAAELERLGIKTVLIADDRPENIAAAQGLAKEFPGINFRFFTEGEPLIAEIKEWPEEIDLVITDNDMEWRGIGIEVLDEAWRRCVPAFILSGGFQHGKSDKKQLVITPFFTPSTIEGWKDSTETWTEALRRYVLDLNQRGSTWSTLLLLRKVTDRTPRYLNDDPDDEWVRKSPVDEARRKLSEIATSGTNTPIQD